jgi:hypothetical protein
MACRSVERRRQPSCLWKFFGRNENLPIVRVFLRDEFQPLDEANGMQEFREFQFAGEAGAHGLPAGR